MVTYVAAVVGLAVLCAVWVVLQRANGGSDSFPGVCRRCEGDCGGSREDCPWSTRHDPLNHATEDHPE
jgi:hypothetical protein